MNTTYLPNTGEEVPRLPPTPSTIKKGFWICPYCGTKGKSWSQCVSCLGYFATRED